MCVLKIIIVDISVAHYLQPVLAHSVLAESSFSVSLSFSLSLQQRKTRANKTYQGKCNHHNIYLQREKEKKISITHNSCSACSDNLETPRTSQSQTPFRMSNLCMRIV